MLHSLALAQNRIFPPRNTSPTEMCSRRESSLQPGAPGWKSSSELCQPATCAKIKKKATAIWDALSKVAQHLLLCLQPPSFCTWTHHTILLVPELSFSFHICCLQIFLSPPPCLNGKARIASPFLRATIASGRGEQQTPLLSWTSPSCPQHRPHEVQCVISHLLAPSWSDTEPHGFSCFRNTRSHTSQDGV